MRDIIFLLCTVGIVLFEFVVGMFLTESMRGILLKDKHWYRYLLICIGLMLFLSALYSWLPGRLGAAVSIFDGALVFEDGAFVRNTGIMFGLQAFGTVLSMFKYLWSVIRKKEKMYGKIILLEVVYAAVFGAVCAILVQNDSVVVFDGGKGAATAVLILLAVIGLGLIIWSVRISKKTKPAKTGKEGAPAASQPKAPAASQPKAPAASQPKAPAASQSKAPATSQPKAPAASQPKAPAAPAAAAPATDSPEAIAEFQRIVSEKNRLTAAKDYASQIPMLIKATELNVNGVLKARIWNYLGMAYDAVGSWQKSLDCYRTALKTDPSSYSARTNIGVMYADHGDPDAGIEYTLEALNVARNKGGDLKTVYINYIYALIRKGDNAQAERIIGEARTAGVDEASIATLRGLMR